MSVIRPRNRLVYFRVSEDEYKQFNQLCKSAGARSISDLARSAMERMVSESKAAGRQDEVVKRLNILDEVIAELSTRLQKVNRLVDSNEDHQASEAVGNGG